VKNVVIAGKAGSGKDTLGDWLVDNHGYRRVSLATPLKRIARELWPDLDWTEKQRPRLQQFGSVCRDVDPDTWIKLAWKDMVAMNRSGYPVVVTDCRYVNELDYFSGKGCTVVRVEASYVNRTSRLVLRDGTVDELALQHISETALDSVSLPTLNNDGSREMLYEQARSLLDP
jgi:hypothetical protein